MGNPKQEVWGPFHLLCLLCSLRQKPETRQQRGPRGLSGQYFSRGCP